MGNLASSEQEMQARLESTFAQWARRRRNAYVWVSQIRSGVWHFELSVGSWPQCREIRASQALRLLEEYSTDFAVANVSPIKEFSYSQPGAAHGTFFEVGKRPVFPWNASKGGNFVAVDEARGALSNLGVLPKPKERKDGQGDDSREPASSKPLPQRLRTRQKMTQPVRDQKVNGASRKSLLLLNGGLTAQAALAAALSESAAALAAPNKAQ
jgi:hypothetical protein